MTKVMLRMVHGSKEDFGAITRVTGYIKGRQLVQLFQAEILDANPRKPKANRVTAEIIETLKTTPELFQFKSKGLLIGTASSTALDRNRFALEFERGNEGILDGGHNMLSIGIYILELGTGEDWSRKVKNWEDLMSAWFDNLDSISELNDELDFYVSAELLVPANSKEETLEEFRIALIDICAARNNNAQLSQEAKANQKGFYDEMRTRFEAKHPELSKRVEWKLNEWESDDRTPVRVRDLVALSWIPLSLLDEKDCLSSQEAFDLNPTLLYSSKAKLSEQFDALMTLDDIAVQRKSGKYELHNTSVGTAFEILTDMPSLVDWIYTEFPSAYNRAGGKFGGITSVKKPKKGTVPTPYFQKPAKFKVPDGFIAPLVYGLSSLMEVKGCKVKWATDPITFLKKHFDEIVEGYSVVITMAGYDPQKVGKDKGSYLLAKKQFQFATMSS